MSHLKNTGGRVLPAFWGVYITCLLNADMSLFLGTTPKKTQWVSSVIAPCIHSLGAKWEVVVSFITPPIKPLIYCFYLSRKRDLCLEDGGSRAVSNAGDHTLVLTSSGTGFHCHVSVIALTSGRRCPIIAIIELILVDRFVQKLLVFLWTYKARYICEVFVSSVFSIS